LHTRQQVKEKLWQRALDFFIGDRQLHHNCFVSD
jgi:hypothetical protein